jgi:hypothetical protein
MRKIIGVMEPTRETKPRIPFFSLETGSKRSPNEQIRDSTGKTKESKARGSMMKRNPKETPNPPPTTQESQTVLLPDSNVAIAN